MKVLVTGATGFLGATVVRALLLRGHNILAGIRKGSDRWRLQQICNQITFIQLDLLDKDPLYDLLSQTRPDIVINCAAYGVRYEEHEHYPSFDINVHGPYWLADAAHKARVAHFLHIGSCFEYGDKDHPIREDEVLEPTSIYGVTKAAGTLRLLSFAKERDFSLAVVRPFGLWGPMEEPYRLVPQVIEHCLTDTPLKLTGGKQIRDYQFVEDAAEMIADLLEIPVFPRHEILNLGSGSPVLLKAFVLNIADYFKKGHLMQFGSLEYRATEMWRLVADIEKWEALVGPLRQTPLSVGIKKTLENFGEGHETD